MERHVNVEYSGKCPSCCRYQSSKKPENVDVLCWKCQAEKGTIRYIRYIRGYEPVFNKNDTPIEIVIDTPESIVTIRSYNPEIFVDEK